jgi:hypothetical protein
MVHSFSDNERQFIRALVLRHTQAREELARAEVAIQSAISTLCAVYGLEGAWRLAEDLSGLVMAQSQMHEGEAAANVQINAGGD